jgi:hypothetical protein
MDLRSKADLRREIERLEVLVDKLEGARSAQEELIERLLRDLADAQGIELRPWIAALNSISEAVVNGDGPDIVVDSADG